MATKIENPFEPPASQIDPSGGARSLLRITFALVNFVLAVVFAIAGVISIVAPESPGQFLGGLMITAPFAFYAFCEWLVLYRKNESAERALGIANLACAGFAIFGVLTNLREALSSEARPDDRFLMRFVLIGGTIVAYLIASGCFRLRWTRSK